MGNLVALSCVSLVTGWYLADLAVLPFPPNRMRGQSLIVVSSGNLHGCESFEEKGSL